MNSDPTPISDEAVGALLNKAPAKKKKAKDEKPKGKPVWGWRSFHTDPETKEVTVTTYIGSRFHPVATKPQAVRLKTGEKPTPGVPYYHRPARRAKVTGRGRGFPIVRKDGTTILQAYAGPYYGNRASRRPAQLAERRVLRKLMKRFGNVPKELVA